MARPRSTGPERVVVFGGSGFIGSHVADALSDAGYEVVVYDLTASPYLRGDQTMIVGNILDAPSVQRAIAGAKYVYHFAGIANLDSAATRPIDTVIQNIEGTVRILDACRKAKIKRFVYAGTIYVYSDKGGFYRCSKQAAELYVEEYRRVYGLDYTTLRFGTVYGPRADRGNSIHRYLVDALTKKKIVVEATGKEIREYVHVKDAARLATQVLSPRHANQRVIITGSLRMTFGELLEMIREILSGDVDIVLRRAKDARAANGSHYDMTPYSFTPRIGYKLTSDCSIDLGQGLLECLNEINLTLNAQKLVPPDLDDRLSSDAGR